MMLIRFSDFLKEENEEQEIPKVYKSSDKLEGTNSRHAEKYIKPKIEKNEKITIIKDFKHPETGHIISSGSEVVPLEIEKRIDKKGKPVYHTKVQHGDQVFSIPNHHIYKDPALRNAKQAGFVYESKIHKGLVQDGLARDRKSTRLNSSHMSESRMPSSA